MELNRKSSLKLTRKPLSNCTNTLNNFPNSKLISQTIANKTRNVNPNFNLIKINYNNIHELNSRNSHTSTGSNKSPNFDCVASQPPTPISHAGDVNYWKIRPSATQIQSPDKQTRKYRKSSVGTPIVQASVFLPSRAPRISAVSANGSHTSKPPAVENRKVDEQKRKDKEKLVVETPTIHLSAPLTSHELQTSSSAASGNYYIPGPFAVHSHRQDGQAKKSDGKIVQVTLNIEASDPTTPPSLVISSSSASGTDDQEKTGSIVYNRRTSQRKKLADGSLSLPFSCAPNKRTKMKGLELDDGSGDGHSGSHTDPLLLHRKKRFENMKNDSIHAMPDDEVDKLKAYYADIDAFELPEEIASEGELE